LPTNIVANTSPWIEHTGFWKANDGRSIDYKNQTPFNPNDYLSDEMLDGEENSESWTDEEVETLLNEIIGSETED
jgi:hypothetical protein